MVHAHISFCSTHFSPEPQILGCHALLDTSPWTLPRLLPTTGSHTGLSVSLNLSSFQGPHIKGSPTVPSPSLGLNINTSLPPPPQPTNPMTCPLGLLSFSSSYPNPTPTTLVLFLPSPGLPSSVSPSDPLSTR